MRNSGTVHAVKMFSLMTFITLVPLFISTAADWPCYRGPDKNGICPERITKWPPREIWRARVGAGYSQVVVSEGRIYCMGWTSPSNDVVYCFSESPATTNPSPLWTFSYYSPSTGDGYEGTRATPTVDGGEVYTYSHMGRLYCLNKVTGTCNWFRTVNVSRPSWGYSSSPLVEGESVIVNDGNRGVAIDKTGTHTNWSSTGYAGHSSALAFTWGALRTVVIYTDNDVFGLDPATGTNFWRFNRPGSYGSMADPIIYGDKLLVTRGYGTGASMVNIGSGVLTVNGEPGEWSNNSFLRTKENCAVVFNRHAYGVDENNGLQCVDLTTGTLKWTRNGFGTESAVMIAGDQLLVVNSANRDLVVVKTDTNAYVEVCKTNISVSGTAWTTPTIANGRLYFRGHDGDLICFNICGDNDQDGMADDWEQRYFPTTTPAPTADSDGDGCNNLYEYVTGTDPTNNADTWKIAVVFSNGNIVVTWNSLAAGGGAYMNLTRLYDLEYTTNILGSDWLPVDNETGLPGMNGVAAFTNNVSDYNRFYRVKVRLN